MVLHSVITCNINHTALSVVVTATAMFSLAVKCVHCGATATRFCLLKQGVCLKDVMFPQTWYYISRNYTDSE